MSLVTVHGELYSDATTAYDLLDDVATVVIEEPRLVDLGDWLRGVRREYTGRYALCDTAGCLAGWVVLLTTEREQRQQIRRQGLTGPWAWHRLGQNRALQGLFDGEVYDDAGQRIPFGHPDYADEVVARIRRYQHDAETSLRATVVEPAMPVRESLARQARIRRMDAQVAAADARLSRVSHVAVDPDPELVGV
jgi:hypothetical protein